MVPSAAELKPAVLIDAILAKRNLGTTMDMAPVVIGVGPGFTAGRDCHAVVETKRGHYLDRLSWTVPPRPTRASPASSRATRRTACCVPRPTASLSRCSRSGDVVRAGQVAATVAGVPMTCTIDGVLRGLLQAGVEVTAGMKSGDIDPRCERAHCFTASDKARAVGGGVLEAICMFTSRLEG